MGADVTLLAHVGEAHPLPWWVPVWVLLAAVALPLLTPTRPARTDVGTRPASGASTAVRASSPARARLAAVAGIAAAAAVAWHGAAQGVAGAVGAAVWVGAVPVAVVLGPWWRTIDPVAAVGRIAGEVDADADSAAPAVGWLAVASLAVLAWLPDGLAVVRDTVVVVAVLLAVAGIHIVGAIWRGRRWSPANEGVRALTDLVGHAGLARGDATSGRWRWPTAPARALTASEAALLAVGTASLSPALLRGLLPHGVTLSLLGPYPVAAALALAGGAAAAMAVGWLVAVGLDPPRRGGALVALASAWLVVGALARLVPTWVEGGAPALDVAAAAGQLAVAVAGHAAAGAAVRRSDRGEGPRLGATLGLVASAGASVVVIVGV